jgi:hypothetical protein
MYRRAERTCRADGRHLLPGWATVHCQFWYRWSSRGRGGMARPRSPGSRAVPRQLWPQSRHVRQGVHRRPLFEPRELPIRVAAGSGRDRDTRRNVPRPALPVIQSSTLARDRYLHLPEESLGLSNERRSELGQRCPARLDTGAGLGIRALRRRAADAGFHPSDISLDLVRFGTRVSSRARGAPISVDRTALNQWPHGPTT